MHYGWNWDPVVLLNVGLLWWLYGRGLAQVWSKAGAGRGVPTARSAAFLAAIVTIVVTLISPLDAMSDQLASAHMVQHMLLVTVAAPLFVLGAPARVVLWALPPPWRHAAGPMWRCLDRGTNLLWHPLIASSLYALTLWLWHVPTLYGAALRHPVVHDLQHLSFFAAACVFWGVLLGSARRRLHPLGATFCLFATSLHSSALGVLLTMAPRPWYDGYTTTTAAWALTPLEDQQLAGLIMWMPACLVYALVALTLVAIWLQREAGAERETRPCA